MYNYTFSNILFVWLVVFEEVCILVFLYLVQFVEIDLKKKIFYYSILFLAKQSTNAIIGNYYLLHQID